MRYVQMVRVATVIAINGFGTHQQDTKCINGPFLKSRLVEVAHIPKVYGGTVEVLELGIP
jgi:hypothetical protein